MKKWIAILLAAVMAFGLTATAMAEALTLNEAITQQTTTAYLTVPEIFTWAIPEFEPTVTSEKITASGVVEFHQCFVKPENVITLSVASENGLCFKDSLGVASIPYSLIVTNPIAGMDCSYVTVDTLFCNLSGNISVSLEAMREGSFTAGTFSDKLTFTAQFQPRADLGLQ